MFRPLIIIILLVISIVFILQNQQPVALVVFGTKMIPLSLATWVLIFVGAGVFTSLLVQWLYKSFGKTMLDGSKVSNTPPTPVPPSRTQRSVRDVFSQNKEELSDSRQFSDTNTSPKNSKNNPEWDRENTDKDWDIETPPSQPTVIQKEFSDVERGFSQQQPRSSEPELINFEVQQQPKTTSRQGSVYSYGYKEAKPSKRSADGVYDADYRVITPPHRDNSPQKTDEDNEDEDWL